MTAKQQSKGAVILSTEEEDLGLVPASDMERKARQAVAELGVTVTARHPVSDEVVATYEPAVTSTPAEREQAIVEGLQEADDDLAIPGFLNRKENPVEPASLAERHEWLESVNPEAAAAMVGRATEKADKAPSTEGKVRIYLENKLRGLPCGRHYVRVLKLGRKWATFECYAKTSGDTKHVKVTREKWNQIAEAPEVPINATEAEENAAMTTDTNKPLTPGRAVPKPTKAPKKGTASKPAKATTKAAKKPAKAKPARKPRETGQPEGKTADCIKLALRPKGVSPAELKEHTGWTGAPWKWLFQNPKKTGWADKYGYKFKVTKVEGETRYCLTK